MKISEKERRAILQVLEAGEMFGFGNMIGHLKSRWAMSLMRDYGMSAEAARAGANSDGYSIEMHKDLVERGEWDETGGRYR